MNDERGAVLVIGKTDEEILAFSRRNPHAATEAKMHLLSNPGMKHGGFARIANQFIDEATTGVVGMLHADTTFAPGAIREFCRVASQGHIVGMVGREGKSPYRYLWSYLAPGDVPDDPLKGIGGEVSTLDACSIFMPRKPELRFDGATFDGFHCVVEDLCIHARHRLGMKIVVPVGVVADHLADSNRNQKWMNDWFSYRSKLVEKWRGIDFHTV